MDIHDYKVTYREGVKKKLGKSGQADRFGGGSPPPSLTKTICENFRTFFPIEYYFLVPKTDFTLL